jgi:hypothetical protein
MDDRSFRSSQLDWLGMMSVLTRKLALKKLSLPSLSATNYNEPRPKARSGSGLTEFDEFLQYVL